VDHAVNNPQREKLSPDAPRESFGEQLRVFFRRNALWFLVVALAWLLVQDIFGTHGVLAMHRSQTELQKIQHEIDELNGENDKLQNSVKDLKSDPAMIEGIAREDMGLARRGELVFKTHQKPSGSSLPAVTQPEPAKKP
jgi:cell division protein FtsB